MTDALSRGRAIAACPRSVAGRTRLRSHTRAGDVGLRESVDGSIRNFAIAGDWILLTKDEDLVERWLNSAEGPPIVWLRIGNCTNQVLFAWLEPLLLEILEQLESGQCIVEVRRESASGR